MIEQMGQATLTLLLTALTAGAVIAEVPIRGRGRSEKRLRTRMILLGLGLGLLASFVLTFVNTVAPKAVNRQTVALWTLPLAIILAIAFVVLALLRRRRKDPLRGLDAALLVTITLYLVLIVFRAAPTAMAQSVMIFPGVVEFFSTQAMLAIVGLFLGWGIAILLGVFAWRLTALSKVLWSTILVVAVLAVTHILLIVRILQAQRVIEMSNDTFKILSWLINHEAVFPIAAMIVLGIVAFLVWRLGRKAPIEGANPAERRLNRARSRLMKVMAGTAAAGYLCGSLLITVGIIVSSAEVELSEPESYSVTNDQAVINIADISDGHLHRYAYTTSSGVEVRFIVIQKAGSSFGVGLDACEICGPSGYYEKDGKVICKLCEVAMNIATIGFKGGCNPIPIEYKVSDGTLTVPISVLEESVDVFA